MDKLNKLLQELEISKVRLAKFLGVSRQMVYNYLDGENLEKMPNDKKMKLFNLLEIDSLDDIIMLWKKINLTTTERVYDSENVSKSDTIYRSENVYRSLDCRECKNILYSDGCANSEFILGCQRTGMSNFCIRVDDSGECTNSYNVICSAKISNSFFIQDCKNLDECIFCSHITDKKYCISNMQFEKEEYFGIKEEIINWILSKNEVLLKISSNFF